MSVEQPLVLLPKRSSFLFQRVVPVAVFFGAIALACSVAILGFGDPILLAPVWGIYALFVGWAAFTASVAVKKERYEVFGSRVVACSGGLFSDRQTDLDFRNVTHVKQRLPWMRYRFFDVGDVMIDSAGSAGDSVVFQSLRDPDGVYAMIRERLKQNGFSLTGQELLHEESPSATGVAVDLAQTGIGIGIGFVWVALSLVGFVMGFEGDGPKGREMPMLVLAAVVLVPILMLVGNIALLIVRALDLRRRTYQIYNDVVEYREGFLTQNNAFIPYENIADADVARNLVDQMFGLADVKISCQGSGSEVRFRRLKHAGGVKRALDQVVHNANAAPALSAAAAAMPGADYGASDASPVAAHQPGAPERPTPRAAPRRMDVPAHEMWTATLSPVPLRSLVTFLPFLWFPPLWIAMIASWIQARVTRFVVTANGVGIHTGVMNKVERQYAYDKVTGVIVKRGPFDRLMKTVSVQICSIGSTQPLEMGHVRESDLDLPRLLRQLGISATPVERTIPAQFTTGTWLRAEPGRIVVTVLVAMACVVGTVLSEQPLVMAFAVLPPLFAIPSWFYRRTAIARQSCTLHADHVELQRGVWWRQHTFARYDDVKKAELTRYPGGTNGKLRLYLAGERVTQSNNGAVAIPYTVDCIYVEQIDGLRSWLDDVLEETRAPGDTSPRPARAVTTEVRPALANAMVPTLIFSVFLLPLLPFIVAWVIISVRRIRYRLEAGRVVKESGVLFRTHTSVLLDRIDSTQQGQGALGKMFGNGSVTLLTAGSSRPDLVVGNIPGHNDFYRTLRG